MFAPPRFSLHLYESAFRLSPRWCWLVYGVFAALLVTELAWSVLYFLDDGSEGGTLVLAWSMKLHGATVTAVLYLFGMLWGPHIRDAWMRKRNCAAGALLGFLVLMLVVTGYTLYYVNGQLLRQSVEYLHWSAGLLSCVTLWVRIAVGRRKRKVAV